MVVMTTESIVQNEPCNLISNGTFNTLFKDDNIIFDDQKGKFIFK